jgi:hypothetical protein
MPESPKPTLPPRHAYQGETSGRMRVVLGVSLLLAIVAVVGLAVDWRKMMPSSPPAPNATQTLPSNTPPADH